MRNIVLLGSTTKKALLSKVEGFGVSILKLSSGNMCTLIAATHTDKRMETERQLGFVFTCFAGTIKVLGHPQLSKVGSRV